MCILRWGHTGSTVKAYETGYPLGHVVDENGKSAGDVDEEGQVCRLSELIYMICIKFMQDIDQILRRTL